jgi:hypothetical protein
VPPPQRDVARRPFLPFLRRLEVLEQLRAVVERHAIEPVERDHPRLDEREQRRDLLVLLV